MTTVQTCISRYGKFFTW